MSGDVAGERHRVRGSHVGERMTWHWIPVDAALCSWHLAESRNIKFGVSARRLPDPGRNTSRRPLEILVRINEDSGRLSPAGTHFDQLSAVPIRREHADRGRCLHLHKLPKPEVPSRETRRSGGSMFHRQVAMSAFTAQLVLSCPAH